MRDPDNTKPWDRALVRFQSESLTWGSRIEDTWIYDVFEIPYPGPQVPFAEAQKSKLAMLTPRQRFFELLLKEHKMLAISERDGGYRIIQPEEQTEFSVDAGQRELKNASNKLRDRVNNVRLEALSEIKRRENADASARADTLARMMKSVWPRAKKAS